MGCGLGSPHAALLPPCPAPFILPVAPRLVSPLCCAPPLRFLLRRRSFPLSSFHAALAFAHVQWCGHLLMPSPRTLSLLRFLPRFPSPSRVLRVSLVPGPFDHFLGHFTLASSPLAGLPRGPTAHSRRGLSIAFLPRPLPLSPSHPSPRLSVDSPFTLSSCHALFCSVAAWPRLVHSLLPLSAPFLRYWSPFSGPCSLTPPPSYAPLPFAVLARSRPSLLSRSSSAS